MSKNTPSKVGRTYGQLKVVEYLGNGLYDCECSCGNHRQVLTTNLRNDKKGVFRCENCQKEYLKNIKRDKKVGQRYDMLEVKEYLGNRKYKCLCDCGNYTIIDTKDLSHGKHRGTKSCGCLTPHFDKDESFFEKLDTEEKAYIAGFIAADGTVVDGTAHGIKITLKSKDRELLEKIKKAMGYTGAVKTEQIETTLPQGTKCLSEASTLFISSKKMVKDLSEKGITPRKSLTLSFDFNSIPREMIRHFLRGYWDGDGTIHLTRGASNKISYRVSCLSSLTFCLQMKEIINSFFPEYNIRIVNTKGKDETKIIEFSTKQAVKDFGCFLYDNATIYLERKFQRHLQNIRNIEKIDSCPTISLRNLTLEKE